MPDILTAAEIEGLARLDAARTPGEWTSSQWGTVKSEHQIIVFTGDTDNKMANAAFIADCSVAVPRMLETIQALRGLLEDSLAVDELKSLLAEATDRGHKMNCWRTPCTCGYDKWMVKVKKILEGEGDS